MTTPPATMSPSTTASRFEKLSLSQIDALWAVGGLLDVDPGCRATLPVATIAASGKIGWSTAVIPPADTTEITLSDRWVKVPPSISQVTSTTTRRSDALTLVT